MFDVGRVRELSFERVELGAWTLAGLGGDVGQLEARWDVIRRAAGNVWFMQVR